MASPPAESRRRGEGHSPSAAPRRGHAKPRRVPIRSPPPNSDGDGVGRGVSCVFVLFVVPIRWRRVPRRDSRRNAGGSFPRPQPQTGSREDAKGGKTRTSSSGRNPEWARTKTRRHEGVGIDGIIVNFHSSPLTFRKSSHEGTKDTKPPPATNCVMVVSVGRGLSCVFVSFVVPIQHEPGSARLCPVSKGGHSPPTTQTGSREDAKSAKPLPTTNVVVGMRSKGLSCIFVSFVVPIQHEPGSARLCPVSKGGHSPPTTQTG